MCSPCQSSNLEVPEARRKAKEVIEESAQVVSDAVSQAVKVLHSTNGMLDGNPDLRMLPVVFLLCRSKPWIRVVFGFSRFLERQMEFCPAAIILVRAQEPEVQPCRDFAEPGHAGVEKLVEELIVMDAPGHDATEEDDGFIRGGYDEAFQGMTAFLAAIAGLLLFVILRPNARAFRPIDQYFVIFLNELLEFFHSRNGALRKHTQVGQGALKDGQEAFDMVMGMAWVRLKWNPKTSNVL